MKLLLTDTNPRMTEAWKSFFSDRMDVLIIEGDLTRLKVDALVSPANSFGFMDGGVDYAISDRLGWDLQVKLQEQIRSLPEGELLIGRALLLETGDADIPWLISAPTMRIPTDFNIATSINAYLAMKAVLVLARQHPQLQRIAIPGFCTGVGKMDPIIAARQMFTAYKEIVMGNRMHFSNFAEAQKYHWNINPQGLIFGS
jgi:O-acetyl-ADP-ribose deacetylase (regulator of RNase III)